MTALARLFWRSPTPQKPIQGSGWLRAGRSNEEVRQIKQVNDGRNGGQSSSDLGLKSQTVARLGRLLLGSGASAHNVKKAMLQLAGYFGITRQETILSLHSIITTSYDDDEFRTEVLESHSNDANTTLVDRTDQYLASLSPGPVRKRSAANCAAWLTGRDCTRR